MNRHDPATPDDSGVGGRPRSLAWSLPAAKAVGQEHEKERL